MRRDLGVRPRDAHLGIVVFLPPPTALGNLLAAKASLHIKETRGERCTSLPAWAFAPTPCLPAAQSPAPLLLQKSRKARIFTLERRCGSDLGGDVMSTVRGLNEVKRFIDDLKSEHNNYAFRLDAEKNLAENLTLAPMARVVFFRKHQGLPVHH